MARPFLAVAAAVVLVSAAVPAANAQSPLAARLASDRLAAVKSGTYQAGDDLQFTIDRDDQYYLLRFAGDPEVFVLYADHASLGGRVLKYDSGKTALQVAGWGGMTLYTDKDPNGLPAVRIGDSVPPALPDASLDDVKNAALDEAEHLAYMRQLTIRFDADWDVLAGDAVLRAQCFDALENAARGLDRFSRAVRAHRVVADRIASVLMTTTDSNPTIQMKGKELVVTFNPERGFAGRASSRAIALALHKLFHLPAKAG